MPASFRTFHFSIIKQLLVTISIVTMNLSCEQPSNVEIVKTFKELEVNGSSSELAELLSDDVIATFSNSYDTLTKEQILLNHEFTKSYLPWNNIYQLKEINDSTVIIHALETSKLLSIFEIDTIGYMYQYTLTNQQILHIEMDTIPQSGFDYRAADSLYNLRLTELFDWISLVHPEKYEILDELNAESSKLILEMAEEKAN